MTAYYLKVYSGKSYWGGRLSTVDLLVLSSLDQLSFILKILFSSFTKQATLMRRSKVLSLSPQCVFPGISINLSTTRCSTRVNSRLLEWVKVTNTLAYCSLEKKFYIAGSRHLLDKRLMIPNRITKQRGNKKSTFLSAGLSYKTFYHNKLVRLRRFRP